MIQVKVKDNTIISVLDTGPEYPLFSGYIRGSESMCVGDDIRWFDVNGNRRELSTLIREGCITPPDGFKFVNCELVLKNDYDRVNDGVLKLLPYQKQDHDLCELVACTLEESLSLGVIDNSEYKTLKEQEVRLERNAQLEDLDIFVSNPLRFNSLPEDVVHELTVYRQALLDVPQQAGFPTNVSWPTIPQCLVK